MTQLFSHRKTKSDLKPAFISTKTKDISIDITNATSKTNTKLEYFLGIFIFLNLLQHFSPNIPRFSSSAEALFTRVFSKPTRSFQIFICQSFFPVSTPNCSKTRSRGRAIPFLKL